MTYENINTNNNNIYNIREYNNYNPTTYEHEFVSNLINSEPNDISYMFFSDNNINSINKRIIDNVLEITFERYNKKMLIEPQQKHILITIMRHIYFKNVKNQECADIEVELLNREVLRQVIPTIITGLLSQIRYINDYNNTLTPYDLPINESTKRKADLRSFSSLFGF